MAQNNNGTAKPRGPGKPFPKGVSGNPGGRPKSASLLSELCRAATADGATLVESALRVLKGEPVKRRDQNGEEYEVCPGFHDIADARDWLADRGWGKAAQAVALTDADGKTLNFTIDLGEK